MKFPERVYTAEEVETARNLVNNGYKHSLTTEGSQSFKQKVAEILGLIKTAECYEFLRSYIRKIVEIDGLTQLRETEATLWANKFAVENPVDGASLLIQKANQMKEYLEGKLHYGGSAEKRSIEKRINFLEILQSKTADKNVKNECARLLKMWEESSLAY